MIKKKVVTGMREVIATLRKSHRAYGVLFHRGVRKATKFLAARSLELTPIDTGDLRESQFILIEGEGFDTVGTVGYAIFYAIYVHENLENFHPVGQAKFLEQPIREYRPVLAKIILDEMKKARDARGRFRKVK